MLAEVTDILRDSYLFRTLSDSELEDIAVLCQEETYQAQEAVHRQGELSEKLYIVVEGAVALERRIKAEAMAEPMTLTIDVLKSGRVFSWTTLVTPHVYELSAICQVESRVLAIEGADLRFVLERNFHAGFEVMKNLNYLLATRVRAIHEAEERLAASLKDSLDAPVGGLEEGLTIGPLTLDLRTYKVNAGSEAVLLTPREFDLLRYFIENTGRVVSSETLLQEAWRAPVYAESPEVVRWHIRNLRGKIDQSAGRPIHIIQTVPRHGYTIPDEVRAWPVSS